MTMCATWIPCGWSSRARDCASATEWPSRANRRATAAPRPGPTPRTYVVGMRPRLSAAEARARRFVGFVLGGLFGRALGERGDAHVRLGDAKTRARPHDGGRD